MNKKKHWIFAALLLMYQPLAQAGEVHLITFADGRTDGGIRQSADTDDGRDSPGDIFVFDQKLLAEDAETVIGRNAGFCIRTDPGAPDYSDTDHPDLPDDPDNNYGHASSLEMYRNLLLVQFDQAEAEKGMSKLLALDARTGEIAYEVPRPVAVS